MSTRYDQVMSSIREGRHMLIDGATGTEVERRGVPQLQNAWNGGGALSHPETVQAIYEDYIRAGARITMFLSISRKPSIAASTSRNDGKKVKNRVFQFTVPVIIACPYRLCRVSNKTPEQH